MSRKETNEVERRAIPSASIELRDVGGRPKIRGYAAVFDVRTTIWPGYDEVIRPGAFAGAIVRDDVRALFNHNRDFVLGRTSSGTLRLWEDERGLGYEITPPTSPTVRDLVLEPMRRGDIDASSFSFRARRAPETIEKGGVVLREIHEVELVDVSPVTYPAYEDTEAQLRARYPDGRPRTLRDPLLELLLEPVI